MPLYAVGIGSRGVHKRETRTNSPTGSAAPELSADTTDLLRVAPARATDSAATPARRPVWPH